MLLPGIDAGVFSAKVCVVSSENQRVIISAEYPDVEWAIVPLETCGMGLSPNRWKKQMHQSLTMYHQNGGYNHRKKFAKGIVYCVNELLFINKEQKNMRDNVIGSATSKPLRGKTRIALKFD